MHFRSVLAVYTGT